TLFEFDLEIVAQVRATQSRRATAAPAATAHEISENVFEDVGHGRGEFRSEAAWPAAPAIFESGMTEPVIGGALLGILQRVIGLVDFLELVLGFGIARIAIGMKLHGELAISALEGRVIGAFLAAEHLVEIAFGQDQLSL